MSILHEFRGGVEIAGAIVIAEALPRVQDIVFRCGGERRKIREAAEPLIIIRSDGGDLGLLEHELGDENGVGVVRAAPRQIATGLTKPAETRRAKLSNIHCRSWPNHDLIVRT